MKPQRVIYGGLLAGFGLLALALIRSHDRPGSDADTLVRSPGGAKASLERLPGRRIVSTAEFLPPEPAEPEPSPEPDVEAIRQWAESDSEQAANWVTQL